MATYTSTSGSYKTTLTVTETNTSIEDNTSTISWSLKLEKTAGTGLWHSSATCPWSVTVDGSVIGSGTFSYDFRNYTTLNLGSGTRVIPHNTDGTKSISVSASVNMDNSGYVSTMNPSGTLALTSLPRTSTVTVSNTTISNDTGQLSATITSKANYYHSWRWKMGNGSWASGSGSSLININNTSLTINISNTSLLNSLPTSASGVLTIEVSTYKSNSTASSELLGSNSATATITISGIKPSITNASVTSVNPSGVTASGFIAGISTGRVTSTTDNSYGSTSVTTYFSTSHSTLNISSSTGTGAKTVTINQLPSSSTDYNLVITIYAIDSRGISSDTVTLTSTVNGYILPRASLTAYRVGSSGSTTEDGSGNYVYISYSGSVSSPIGGTTANKSCKYDLSSPSSSSSNVNVPSSPAWIPTSGESIMDITLTVSDAISSSVVTVTVSSAAYPLDLYDDGEGHIGVGFGKEAKPNITSSAMQITGPGAIEYIEGTWASASNTWTGVTKDYELYDGKQILLYMPYAGNSDPATLELTLAGGATPVTTTGAKEVYFESNNRFTTHKGQYSVLHLIYLANHTVGSTAHSSGAWWYIANRDTNDAAHDIRLYTLRLTTKTALYRYMLCFINGNYLIPVNAVSNSTATTKTLTTESFDPFMNLLYYATTSTINANSVIGSNSNFRWQWYSLDLRYSFNTGTTLTANRPIYIVCVPQTDGKVKLHSSPITQTLPTTNDGLIYKFIGMASSTSGISLYLHQPCYYYHDGAIREWTANNWITLWTGTLKGGATQSIDMTRYSKLKIYANCYYSQLIFELDLTTATKKTYESGYPYAAGGFASELTTSSTCEHLFCFSLVNTAKTTFNNAHMGFVANNTTTLRDNNDNFYIYKIEGFI